MKYRQLGRNGPTVSAIGYGAMVLSPGIYNPVEEEESLTTIERVFDLGINFVDTADIYGQGHNERLIGGAIRVGPSGEGAPFGLVGSVGRDCSPGTRCTPYRSCAK